MNMPIIFPSTMVHAEVAKAVEGLFPPGMEVVSAGDINLVMSDIHVSGQSATLNLDSRPEDAAIIKMHDYLQGLE